MAKIPNKIKVAAAGGLMSLTVAMVMYFEGVRYQPYQDVAGVWTVCAGITGSDVIQGKKYTQKECDDLLVKHMKSVVDAVDKLVIVDIPDTTRAALYSLTYNIGITAFKNSTLLKKLNSGDQVGACNEFRRWVYAGGKPWKGLMTRRDIEEAVCTWSLESPS